MAKRRAGSKGVYRAKRGGRSTVKRDLLIVGVLILVAWLLLWYPTEISAFVNGSKTTKTDTLTATKQIITESKIEKDPIMSDKPKVISKTSDNVEVIEPKKSKTEPKSATKTNSNNLSFSRLELPVVSDSTYLYYNRDGRYYVMYNPAHKIPDYVAYLLTRKEVSQNLVKRYNKFDIDSYYNSKRIEQADNKDYLRSGYDKGHMIPSADRNDSKIENRATFLFSNITPQNPNLNRQTLSQLEKMVRSWSLKYDSLYIVTGSLIADDSARPTKKVGKGVTVPQYIYKVIAAKSGREYKTIGFVMPNIESVSKDYFDYIESVDNIEKMTGVDFFHQLPDSIEDICERSVDLKFWK